MGVFVRYVREPADLCSGYVNDEMEMEIKPGEGRGGELIVMPVGVYSDSIYSHRERGMKTLGFVFFKLLEVFKPKTHSM